MTVRRLDESTGFLGSLSWSAIATGTFIALAVQTVFLLLGLAVATSFGDRAPGGVYSAWTVLVELCAIAIGAALTARLSHAERRSSGVAAGVITWAVVLVLGSVFQGLTMTRALGGSGAWAAFIGAVVSLGAAIVGGWAGVRLGASSGTSLGATPTSRNVDVTVPPTHAPVH
jgi:hypothetical protein